MYTQVVHLCKSKASLTNHNSLNTSQIFDWINTMAEIEKLYIKNAWCLQLTVIFIVSIVCKQ